MSPRTRGAHLLVDETLSRYTDTSAHPVQHLLVGRWLGLNPDTSHASPPIDKPFGEGPWPCLNPASGHRGSLRISNITLSMTGRHRPKGLFACPNCRFAYYRQGPDCSPKDRYRIGEVKRWGRYWDTLLRKAWGNQSLTLKETTQMLGVSYATMRRQAVRLGLHRRPGMTSKIKDTPMCRENYAVQQLVSIKRRLYKAMWLSVRRSCPHLGRAELAKLYSPIKAFLYRHDRQWLVRHQPVARKRMAWAPLVDWGARDERLVSAISGCVWRLRNHVGKPLRITRHVIWKTSKDERWHTGPVIRSDKLPKTLECMRGLVETKEDFALRRVRWARESFIRSRVVPTRTEFIRRAGLNVETRRLKTVSAQINSAVNDLRSRSQPGSAG